MIRKPQNKQNKNKIIMKKFLLSIFAVMLAVFSVQAEGTWTLVKSASDLAVGDKVVIAAARSSYAMSKQNSNNRAQAAITKTGDTMTFDSEVQELTLAAGKTAGTFAFNTGSGYLYAASSSKNYLRTESTLTANSSWNITITSAGVATIKSTGSYSRNWLRYNSSNNPPIFSCYSSEQADVCLYKYVEETAGGDEVETTATPVITPAGGEITADTEITITCATEGAKIYYTTDRTIPTTSSTLYSGAFKLDAAATVKAIAVADGLETSDVVTADFTFPVVCENIAAFIANADKENYATISGEVVVVAQSGKYLFVQDNSAKILVFGELGTEYNAGDRLTGIKGKYSPYNGLVEMVPDAESFGEATPGDAIAPVAITLDKLSTTDLLTYVTISDVNVPAVSGKSYTVTDATGTATMYNTLGIEVPTGVGTITGFVSVFNTTRQLMPLEIVVVSAAPAAPTLTAECEFEEKMTVEITNVAEGATAYYSLNNDTDWEEGTSVEITETTTVYAKVVKDGVSSEVVSAKYTKNEPVTPPAEGEATEVVDVLNREFTGIKNGSTNYASWSGKKAASAAVYAGNSAGSNDAIQLRSTTSKNSTIHAGVVTTTSGGRVKKIVVKWNSNTKAERELWVFGKNSAYTTPDDLYKDETAGDKLTAISFGTEEFVIDGDYEYIGLRSGDGAMYIDEIQIIWAIETEEPTSAYTLSVTGAGYATLFLDFAAAIPEDVEVYTVTAVNTGYVTLTQVTGVLPANTGVIVKAGKGDYNFVASTVTPATVTGNLLEGTAAATEINVEAYVLGNVDGVGLYKAKMTDGVWLNNANKAYLPASEVPANVKSLSFRFGEGTTAIENVEVENEVKTIFDLTGRRVEEVTAPGIYIINGKKVLVK